MQGHRRPGVQGRQLRDRRVWAGLVLVPLLVWHFEPIVPALAMWAVVAIGLQSIFSEFILPASPALNESLRAALKVGVPLIAAGGSGAIAYLLITIGLRSEEVRGLLKMIGHRA